jgi:hypothetical protein
VERHGDRIAANADAAGRGVERNNEIILRDSFSRSREKVAPRSGVG